MKQDPQGVLGVEGAGEVGASYEFTLEKDSKNENTTKLDVRSSRWLEANLHVSRFSPSL